ncbi:MAG: hypothetical protein HQK65_04945 [Desulfamplus sp.]|nr:hypothetical protein [Desulfamplus sp.]
MDKKKRYSYFYAMAICLFLLVLMSGVASAGIDPPASPVKLIFIHHSTGGNWLADPNESQPYGALGSALMNNNYYVSATNYGWGPQGIGDRTDIPNWPEWFVGPRSNAIMAELFNEIGQNFQDYGQWPRLSSDPGGENTIIMFKSCFPNSDLFGEPYDDAASEVNEQYTVSNAKAVYNVLRGFFATRQDKLFVVITAPPQTEEIYAADYQTPAHRAANARAFNNWLVNDWLDGYPYKNVVIFDYFNVLTGVNNHHRYNNGAIEHVTVPGNDMSAYPTDRWDAHPNTAGQQKATEEFVPLLNYYYNEWRGSVQPDPLKSLPVADIKLNGADNSLAVSSSESVTLSVGIDPGSYSGVSSDWWLVHLAPGNVVRSFSAEEMNFINGLSPVVQMPLLGFSSVPLVHMSGLDPGSHTFCFGIDMAVNGVPDIDSLCYDCMVMDVKMVR